MSIGRIAVLFSGDGTNLANLIKTLHNTNRVKIVVAISNRADAKGIKVAKDANIPTYVLEHTKFKTREEFDSPLVELIQKYNPDISVLAGFMRILTPIFTSKIGAINLHPSLLPLFKGANAIERNYYSNIDKGGVSVHFVEQELDSGAIILQEECEIKKDDSLEDFKSKIRTLEHKLLPKAILKVLYT